ncbi:MAG: SufE family protein [Anaerolineaceae bacterium]|nr:SufE family protein [Anaerolineaceae bacterium]
MAKISELEQTLIDDFAVLENWEERYDYLIELGQSLPPMNPALKTDENKVKGCQSSVWFAISCKDEHIFFEADSDSLIIKGIVSILQKLLSGQPALEVEHADLTIFNTLGLWKHLSSQRSNGVTSMLAHLRAAAVLCGEGKNLDSQGHAG